MANLFAFERQYARELQQIARNSLSGARTGSETPPQPPVRTEIYIVDPGVAGIPAAVDTGGVLTPGNAQCKLLWRVPHDSDPQVNTIRYLKDRAGADVSVTVYNHTKIVINGSSTEPVNCHMDRMGALWAVSGTGDGQAYIAMAETKTTLSAGTITAGVLTPGSGLVYLLRVGLGGAMERMKDDLNNDIEVLVNNAALQVIVKDDGRVLQLNQDINGAIWAVPPDYGPSIMFENTITIAAATYTSGTDTLSPTTGTCFLLAYNAGTGDVERRKDSGGTDIQMTVRNSLVEAVDSTKGKPRFADRDPDGNYWIRSAGGSVVFFSTYGGPLNAASGLTPGKSQCNIFDFNGTAFVDSGTTEEINNMGPEIASGDTTIRMANVTGAGENMYDPGTDVCDANNDMAIIAGGSIDDIEYLIGIDINGDCKRVPVASCPTQVQHG